MTSYCSEAYHNGAGRTIKVSTSCDDHGAMVAIEGDSAQEPLIRYKFQVRNQVPSIRCKGASNGADRWPLISGIVSMNRKDPFVRCMSVAYKALFRGEARYPSAEGMQTIREANRHRASAEMRLLYHQLREIAVHLVSCCDVDARKVAMKFLPHLRFKLYKALVDNPTGRLAQMAEVCPGLLIFALAFSEQKGTRARQMTATIFKSIIEGHRLDRIIEDALSFWVGRITADFIDRPEKLARFGEPDSHTRKKLLTDQRILIRRASPRVPTTTLWLPPPLKFAPEDIPTKVMANARWFKSVKARHSLLFNDDSASDAIREAVASFLSKNGANFCRTPKCHKGTKIDAIFDYLVGTGRSINRHTPMQRTLEECDRWHDEMHQVGRLEDLNGLTLLGRFENLIESLPEGQTNIPLNNPIPEWVSDNKAIVPLKSSDDLIKEGNRMQHCVASRLTYALKNERFYFSAEIAGNPLTIELRHSGRALVLGEAKGIMNREPRDDEIMVIHHWLKGFASDFAVLKA